MLAARRFFFRFTLMGLFCLVVVSSLPLQAQSPMEFHGVPASGIGGTHAAFSAVRPNANGYGGTALGCCASFFFPSSFSPMVPYPSFGTPQRAHHGHRRHGHEGVVVAEPVYIPYAVPYAVDAGDDGADEQDEQPGPAADEPMLSARSDAPGGPRAGRGRTLANGVPEAPEQDPGGNAEADSGSSDGGASAAVVSPEAAPNPPEPVVAQPTTVLVFKDGHRSEVVNYAIVGDTLFDFSGDRARKILIADLDIAATQKANDAAGVEFKLPPGEAR